MLGVLAGAVFAAQIAISIDDGPSAMAGQYLSVLSQKGVHATFFWIGQNVRSNGGSASSTISGGHEVGCHSDNYDSMGSNSASQDQSLLSAAISAMQSAGAPAPKLFRAPNLDYSTTLLQAAGQLGMAVIGTDVLGHDWESGVGTSQIVNYIVQAAHDGGIILLHEQSSGDTKSVEALGQIIDQLKAKGYEFFTVSGLAQAKGVNLQAGTRYDKF